MWSTALNKNDKNMRRDDEHITEKRWAMFGVVFSCSVIIAKLLYSYGDVLKGLFIDTELTKIEHLAENGQLMFMHVYRSSVKYSSIWLPLLCGLLATYITWVAVYLDSDVPGVHPPTPLSPQRVKRASGHAFHLSYIFSLMLGITVTYYMYAKGVHIEFAL